MNNFHTVWCSHRESEETHDDDMPYCNQQVHGIKLISTTEGEEFPPSLWIYATSAAHPCALASGERVINDHLFDGIELVTEHRVGDTWVDKKYRLTSDAARSLAAALVRAADIQQGLTR